MIDIVKQLQDFDCNIDIYDPLADPEEVKQEYGIDIITREDDLKEQYEGIMVAVAYNEFKKLNLKKIKARDCVVFDVKNFMPDADEYL